jgi:predicted transcriptional regulator
MQYHYKVKDLMTPNPAVIDPNASLKEAAERMLLVGCGAIAVGTQDYPIGMITDRDIAIRAVAEGKDPAKTKVSEVMTGKVSFVNENTTLNQALDILKKQQITRVIVKDLKGKMTGILSLGTLIRENAEVQDLSLFVSRLADRIFRRAA